MVEYAVKPGHDRRTLGEKLRALPFLDARFQFFIFILLPVRTLFAHQFLTLPDYVLRCFPENVGARYEWFQGLNPLIIVIFVPVLAALTRRVNIITMMIVGTLISALPLRHACQHFGITPEHGVLVGDSSNDVEAARAAGMPVLCVPYGYNHGHDIRESHPDAVVGSLVEVDRHLVLYTGA